MRVSHEFAISSSNEGAFEIHVIPDHIIPVSSVEEREMGVKLTPEGGKLGREGERERLDNQGVLRPRIQANSRNDGKERQPKGTYTSLTSSLVLNG